MKRAKTPTFLLELPLQAFSALRKKYRFSEYELHESAKRARVSWIADHIESTMAQTLATRA